MEFNEHLLSYLSDEEIKKLDESIKEDNLKAVLLNLRKMDDEAFLSLFSEVTPHPLVKHAYIYDPKKYQLGKSIYHDLGCFYIQEPSAMVVSSLLNPNEDDVILDLCGAPGGKTIQASFLMNNKGLIVSNDLSRSRASTTLENVERLGIGNVIVTNNDFSKIYHKYKSTFSKIILDAPCSGSGMFKKNEKMIEDWSYNKVLKFAETQKELILMAYSMLKEGGTLIYSTCSFSMEEDEDVILHLLNNSDAEVIDISNNPSFYINKKRPLGIHLLPHLFSGDGHYICLIKKPGNLNINKIKDNNKINLNYDILKEIDNKNIYKYGDFLFASYKNYIDISPLSILRTGLKIGEIKGKDLLLDFHLSRYLSTYKNEYHLTKEELDNYIKGNVINTSTNKGFVLMKYKNIPVSFGKSDGEKIKNHYPKHLRK